MSRRVCSKSSGRATAGSYSTSACSCVRLTATWSTPGIRLSSFSRVPVQSEQWRPPIRARIFLRPGRVEGSSLQGWTVDAMVVAVISHLQSLRFGGESEADGPDAENDQKDTGPKRDTPRQPCHPVERSLGGFEEDGNDERQREAEAEDGKRYEAARERATCRAFGCRGTEQCKDQRHRTSRDVEAEQQPQAGRPTEIGEASQARPGRGHDDARPPNHEQTNQHIDCPASDPAGPMHPPKARTNDY